MGLLRQQEVNKHRPTVSVSPHLVDVKLRQELIAGVVFPAKLEAKLVAAVRPAASADSGPTATADPKPGSFPTPHLSSGAGATETKPDWQWTLGLFRAGHNWEEVASLRRMSDQELAASLCLAVRAGVSVERAWLAGLSQKPRTAGQQQVVAELRRQSAAWSN
jgi:hypothetical protein